MNKTIDLLIFGATGFTGRFIVEHLVKTIERYNKIDLRWAVAGRNIEQLNQHLNDIENVTRIKFKNQLNIFKCDINDSQSLKQVFSQCKLVMNCVGPYSLLGEPVLKACLDSDANYMDICGEPLFLEQMQLKYDHQAKHRRLCAVTSCAFDSIPSDIGVQYLKQQINNLDGHLNHVESFLRINNSKMNYATWNALVEGYKHRNRLKSLRQELFKQFDDYKWPYSVVRHNLYRHPEFNYCVPFLGSDRSVVARSQLKRYTLFKELPAQFEIYFSLHRVIDIIKLAIINYNLKLLTKFEIGEKLLLKHSNIFSFGIFDRNQLPKRDLLENNKFSLTLIGYGWPMNNTNNNNFTKESIKELGRVIISGGDLAYIDTSKIAIQTALTFLEKLNSQQQNLQYGVQTPAIVFEPNELVPKYRDEDIRIEFISKI